MDASALLELVRRLEQDPQYLHGALTELHGLFEVIAPDIVAYEIANVLSRQRHIMGIGDPRARERLIRLLLADVTLAPVDQEAVLRIFRIAGETGLSAYDAAYVELAGRLDGSALVTEDRALLKIAEAHLGPGRAFPVGELGQGGNPYREPFAT